MSIDHVPFLDLVSMHQELEEELVEIFRNAVRNARFIGGPPVEDFERDFAVLSDTSHCKAVNSGTDALRFALIAAGVKKDETVVTAPNTFIATTEAISQAGALVDFVDIDETTYNMDPEKLREYLETSCNIDDRTGRPVNKRTGSVVSAVVPVHLYGQIADMDNICAIAKEYNLYVIEDACQAHGAQYFSRDKNRWCTAGSIGLAAAFSFYPGKNLGACGEGGAVTTNDSRIAQVVTMLRDHGQIKKYYHDIEGYNGRLDSIQASILQKKLKYLGDWNESRRRNAFRYNLMLRDIDGIITPSEPEHSRSVYHLYVIRSRRRDELQQYLAQNSIDTGLHYPIPLHLQKAYANRKYSAEGYPVSEKLSQEILSLPMYPALREEQQEYVARKISQFSLMETPHACQSVIS